MRTVLRALMITTTTLALAHAETTPSQTPGELRRIMQNLGQNMQQVAGAISREDWAQIAELAPLIAEHPAPPMAEKARILNFLGNRAGQFRELDHAVHKAAEDMGQAAKKGDGKEVIKRYAQVQHSCLACHQAFRPSYQQHFLVK
ncbi:cytochrome c [Parachitinimonas caeni]|uniref:Cytochrome c n=1 Tax=Parachitinimonas caeni TaxID=3031301 RepID=A0ABT7DYW2_9NEIS|nr:cytochrome c [Parachitinimonas caeni]MDK2125257.1 cytochrome c [Parachitinimonas caeni]